MKRMFGYLAVALVAAVACFLITSLAFNIQDRKHEAHVPFVRLQEVNEVSTDPQPWSANWPHQYDGYVQTAGDKFYGGSSALPDSKLDQQPWLKRLYAGYAFSLDYREARGHAYMLYDQGVTERVTKRQQSGACLHCHASIAPTYRRIGLQEMGKPADESALAEGFNWPAVMKGFETVSTKKYEEILAEIRKTPDGTPDDREPVFPEPPEGGFPDEEKAGGQADASAVAGTNGETNGKNGEAKLPDGHVAVSDAHPVSCIDCHDPKSMAIRVTRPGFVNGMVALSRSDAPTPHLPSVEKWRRGDREKDYDPNLDASRQEMRTFVCAQCHVEYYCANKMTLTFPWGNGLKAEQLEQFWDETTFPDGSKFYDYEHAETGAKVYKVQHPEFELWSQGIHARSGVSCADCHMPFERKGAQKLSSHNVQSPMKNINHACQTCHKVPENDLRFRVETIQETTRKLMERSAVAMTEMLDTINAAKANGLTNEQLADVFALQRKSMWRLDYISSENSQGFHAAQESARILGESIDYSRQAQMLALKLQSGTTEEVGLSDEDDREMAKP